MVESIAEYPHKNSKIESVHRQQRLFLDTVALVYRALVGSIRGFSEPVWFAAQVLHSQCQIRHLEDYSAVLEPLATELVSSMDNLRHTGFYAAQDRQPMSVLYAPLRHMACAWRRFEDKLYRCYMLQVFDEEMLCQLLKQQRAQLSSPSPPLPPMHIPLHSFARELFSDSFTQLLPITLERALCTGMISADAVCQLDAGLFIVLPRLAVLAGMTWLSAQSQWMSNRNYPVWFRSVEPQMSTLAELVSALENDIHHPSSSPSVYLNTQWALERAIVTGQADETLHTDVERAIYRNNCTVADSLLTGKSVRPISMVLSYLFRHFGQQLLAMEEDLVDGLAV